MNNKEIVVSVFRDNKNIRIGSVWFQVRGGKESASFRYDESFLKYPDRFALCPNLPLTEGIFHTTEGAKIFGPIGDSAPDRWGRTLMRRAQALKAKKEVPPLSLFEIDYVLGVNDYTRQGALRYSTTSDISLFLAPADKMSIPPLVDLPKLLSAAEAFSDDNESIEELKLLLAPGSSLGGARPKASIREKDGSLAIAKFSKKDDEYAVPAWEAVALALAQKAGVRVPTWRLEKISKKPVLIIKRFDRAGENRIPFVSAMSMLEALDNEQRSYLEIAYVLAQNGSLPDQDMQELWRRVIFSLMIANTDDHLRNHGFLYEWGRGWRLSPAFDLNPTPIEIKPRILATTIDFGGSSCSFETALLVAEEFRLKKREAHSIMKEVAAAVKEWQAVALDFGISKKECDRMSSAFKYEKNI